MTRTMSGKHMCMLGVELPELKARRDMLIRSIDKQRVRDELRRKFELPHRSDSDRPHLESLLDLAKTSRDQSVDRVRELRPILTIVYQNLAEDMPLLYDLCSGLLGSNLAQFVNPTDVELRGTVDLNLGAAPMLRLEIVPLDALEDLADENKDSNRLEKTDVLIFVAVSNIDRNQLSQCGVSIDALLPNPKLAARFVLLAEQEPEFVRRFVDSKQLPHSITVGRSGNALKDPSYPGLVQLRRWIDQRMASVFSAQEKPQDDLWGHTLESHGKRQRDFSNPGVPKPPRGPSGQYPVLPPPPRHPFTDTQKKLSTLLNRFCEEWPADDELTGEGKLGEQLRRLYPPGLEEMIEAGIGEFLSSRQDRSLSTLKPSGPESSAVAFAGQTLQELWSEVKEQLINAAHRMQINDAVHQAVQSNVSWFEAQLRTIPDLAGSVTSFPVELGRYPIAPVAEAMRSALSACDAALMRELSTQCANAGASFLSDLQPTSRYETVSENHRKWSFQWFLEWVHIPWGRKPKPTRRKEIPADPDRQRRDGETKLRMELAEHLMTFLEQDSQSGSGLSLRRRLNEAFQKAAAENLLPLRRAAAAYVAPDGQAVREASFYLERLIRDFAARETLRERLKVLKSEEAASLAAQAVLDASELRELGQCMTHLIQTAREALK